MNWHFWRRRPDDDDCDSLNPLLSPYSDGLASPDEARRIEAHLPDCPLCRQSLLWMQATRRAIASRPVLIPPADLRARIAQGIAASGRRTAPVRIPSARRALALRPALAGAFTLAALGVVGYSLLESHPAARLTPKTQPLVATVPSVIVLPVTPGVKPHPLKPSAKPARPRLNQNLIANGDTSSQSPDTAETQPAPDTTKTPAVTTHVQTAPPPTKAPERVVTPTEAPRPRVIPRKKPTLPRFNPSLIATNGTPKPSPVNVPAPKKPDANSQVALMPKESTGPRTPALDTVVLPPTPAPEVVATAGPRVQTASLLSSVQDSLRTRRTGVEHFSRSEYTALRPTTHTAVYTSSSSGEEGGKVDFVHTP